MRERLNGYFRLAAICVSIAGLFFLILTWSTATFATKLELNSSEIHMKDAMYEIQNNIRTIQSDIKEILRVVN